MTRLYVPATLVSLAELDEGSVLGTAEAFAAVDESEESEYAALVAAAESSADLVAGLGEGLRRRVVVVADPPGEPPTIAIGDVVAVHADADDDAGGDDDLGWYAVQEIPDLIRGN
jgi:hypothetical protein